MNILRTITPNKKFLYNVVYKDNGKVDKLGIHMAQEDNTWSEALPLEMFPLQEIGEMYNSIEKTIKTLIKQ